MVAIIVIFLIVFLAIFIFYIYWSYSRKKEFREKIKKIYDEQKSISTYEFFKIYNDAKKYSSLSKVEKVGIYILFNKTLNMYYVGQSRNVFKRVNNHFTGKGNGDVYADYKYGNEFEIKFITCSIEELNSMEREYIEIFNSYNNGYNKNKGNL